jgi:peptidoglycan L-alanyl-D-glutamate endopeptidase CwlK
MSLVSDIQAIQEWLGIEKDGVFGPRTANAVLAELRRRAHGVTSGADISDSPLDPRTEGWIETLDPKGKERFTQLACLAKATAATFGCDYIMISGHRTLDEQDALYAQRPKVTNAPGGHSNHNFGIAADFGVFRGKSYLDEANPILARRVHEAVAIHARKLGFEWGGDWAKFKDYPHFEISTGLSMAEKRQKYQAAGSVL